MTGVRGARARRLRALLRGVRKTWFVPGKGDTHAEWNAWLTPYSREPSSLIGRKAGDDGAEGRRSSTFTRLLRHGFTDPSAAERLLESRAAHRRAHRPGAAGRARRSRRPRPRAARTRPARRGAARRGGPPRTAGHPDRRQAAARPAARRARRLRGARRPPGPAPARLADPGHLRGGGPAPRRGGVRARARQDADDPDALRVAYRRCLLAIAARDVCGTTDLSPRPPPNSPTSPPPPCAPRWPWPAPRRPTTPRCAGSP